MKSQNTFIVMICMLCSLLSACGEGYKTVTNSSLLGSEIIDDGITNQAAKINCDLFLNNSSNLYRKISTISSTDTFTENAKEGDKISFDCSQTQDEQPVDNLSFSLDRDYQPSTPSFENLPGKNFELNVDQVGRFPMALRVVDPQGKERIKTFTVVVECIDAETPILDTSKINVSTTSKLNYFNYSIDSGAVSGGQGFQYAWDFNGDYVFDPVSLQDPNEIWTANSTLNNIYSIFVTEGNQSRQISVKVKNNCEKESSYTINAKFPNSNIARIPSSLAEVKPYFYLQADISGDSSNDIENLRKNGDLLVTQYPVDTPLKRIECDYKKARIDEKAVFSMKAYNYYKEGPEFQHGMEIQIQDINDLLQTGTQEITDANLEVTKYKVSAADDGLVSETYDRASNCQLKMRIIRQVAITPCAEDKKAQADYKEAQAITILGEFSCPTLRDAHTMEAVKVDNGKFYCQVAPRNQCVGGGGGGGGIPPIEQ